MDMHAKGQTEKAKSQSSSQVINPSLVIRFAGDSGDGIQLTGDRYAKTSAFLGQDVVTLADFPAEIRAPKGTLYGVSGYQLHLGEEVYTPGDEVDVLVVMNAAALKTNLEKLKKGGILIVNTDGFSERETLRSGFAADPLKEAKLEGYRTAKIALTKLTRATLEGGPLSTKEKDRCKNFYALGLIFWLTQRPLKPTLDWIDKKFSHKEDLQEGNKKALKAGYNSGEAKELFSHAMQIQAKKEHLKEKGLFRYINGNTALALGLLTASQKAGRRLFFGSYPITPASDILHELSKYRHFPLSIFQAEDEIAAIGAALGASFAGALGACATSGPGLALKSEFLGLGVITELPLVIIDVQRSGPSTGMPTKTEQTDLLLALWGRNGESPLCVMAPSSPSDCFDVAFMAAKIAIKYMTPVIVLSDGYLANGSQSWKIPDASQLESIDAPNPLDNEKDGVFMPFQREKKTLARSWASPGTAHKEHRLGGLEKEDGTGHVSYDPLNHEKMVALRAAKMEAIKEDIGKTIVEGDQKGELLLLGWGSTYGAIKMAKKELFKELSYEIPSCHLRFIQPFAPDLQGIFARFKRVLVPENNNGQLLIKLRSEYPKVTFIPVSSVTGQPFKVSQIKEATLEALGRKAI